MDLQVFPIPTVYPDNGSDGKHLSFFEHWGSCILSIYFLIVIYLVLVALSLYCCVWAFSSCRERGLLCISVAWLFAEHTL